MRKGNNITNEINFLMKQICFNHGYIRTTIEGTDFRTALSNINQLQI